MFSKVEVNGSSAHPLYKYLKSRVRSNLGSFVKWNFEKVCCTYILYGGYWEVQLIRVCSFSPLFERPWFEIRITARSQVLRVDRVCVCVCVK